MTNSMHTGTTISHIAVTMFTVADQDAAAAFYTEKLGFEVRADVGFGENGMRWLEVAPAGSEARLSLNPPMGDSGVGGGSIGVETSDVIGEHERLKALGDVDVDDEPMRETGAPLMFSLRDPDGNYIWVVEAPAAR